MVLKVSIREPQQNQCNLQMVYLINKTNTQFTVFICIQAKHLYIILLLKDFTVKFYVRLD